jgi:hypothetical protein
VDIEAKFMEVKEMVDRDVELLIDELYADAHDLEDVAVSFDPPQLPPRIGTAQSPPSLTK